MLRSLFGNKAQKIKKILAGLMIVGASGLISGCEINIEGLDELDDYVVEIIDGCDHCGYDVIEVYY